MINLSKDELEQVKKVLLPVFEKKIPVWVFGSRANGLAEEASDLDLVIVGKSKMPLSEYFALKDAFEYSELPFRVDLLDWHRISKEFQKLILRNYESLFE